MSRCLVGVLLCLLFGSCAMTTTNEGYRDVGDGGNSNENKSVDAGVVPYRYCDNMLSCINRDLYVSVVDIVGHRLYKLSDNLVFERLPGVNASERTPPDTGVLWEKNGVTTLVLMKKTMDIFNTHALRLQLLRDLDIAVYREAGHGTPRLSVALEANTMQRGGRTFGVMRRRIAFVLLAIMFKLGLMSAMLMMLIVLTVKGLKLGVLLLALTFANYSGKALPILPFPSMRPMDEAISSVPPMHIHVHKDMSGPEWPPESYGLSYPQDMGGPYPYPPSQSRTQAQLQLDIPLQYPSMRKTNHAAAGYYARNPPGVVPGYMRDSHSTANPPGYSVYYQKKNGQFYPVVINDAHRQTMANIGDVYDTDDERNYPSMYRSKRRRDDDVDDDVGDVSSYDVRHQ